MADRDRLIELLKNAKDECLLYLGGDCIACAYKEQEDCTLENIADYLLANGVIVPPCPIGARIYMLVTKRPKCTLPEFTFIKDSRLTFSNLERVCALFGKTVFLTREEAERALKERENNG